MLCKRDVFFYEASARLNITASRGNTMLNVYCLVDLVFLTIQCQILGSDYSKVVSQQTLMMLPCQNETILPMFLL